MVYALWEKGIPIAVIGEGAVEYTIKKVDIVIISTEGVVENRGIIS